MIAVFIRLIISIILLSSNFIVFWYVNSRFTNVENIIKIIKSKNYHLTDEQRSKLNVEMFKIDRLSKISTTLWIMNIINAVVQLKYTIPLLKGVVI